MANKDENNKLKTHFEDISFRKFTNRSINGLKDAASCIGLGQPLNKTSEEIIRTRCEARGVKYETFVLLLETLADDFDANIKESPLSFHRLFEQGIVTPQVRNALAKREIHDLGEVAALTIDQFLALKLSNNTMKTVLNLMSKYNMSFEGATKDSMLTLHAVLNSITTK